MERKEFETGFEQQQQKNGMTYIKTMKHFQSYSLIFN